MSSLRRETQTQWDPQETARRLTRAILDVIGPVDSPIASSLPSTGGSASGSVNAAGGQLIHGVGWHAD
jgi:hypothetical protein